MVEGGRHALPPPAGPHPLVDGWLVVGRMSKLERKHKACLSKNTYAGGGIAIVESRPRSVEYPGFPGSKQKS